MVEKPESRVSSWFSHFAFLDSRDFADFLKDGFPSMLSEI
jgi:hypothetical protein